MLRMIIILCEFIVLIGEDFISWQNLCPIPFVKGALATNLTKTICF